MSVNIQLVTGHTGDLLAGLKPERMQELNDLLLDENQNLKLHPAELYQSIS